MSKNNNGITAAKKNETSVVDVAAGAVVAQAGAALVTINPATVAVVAAAVVAVAIGGAIAYAISTRGKSVKVKVGDVFDMEAEFH